MLTMLLCLQVDAVMEVRDAYVFCDGSVLVNDYLPKGSLLVRLFPSARVNLPSLGTNNWPQLFQGNT